MAHRVAFAHYHGRWPVGILDHDNRDGLDNSIENLLEATHSENIRNRNPKSKSGFKGVGLTSSGRWGARICIDGGKQVSLGCYDTPEEAAEVYRRAVVERYGERYVDP